MSNQQWQIILFGDPNAIKNEKGNDEKNKPISSSVVDPYGSFCCHF